MSCNTHHSRTHRSTLAPTLGFQNLDFRDLRLKSLPVLHHHLHSSSFTADWEPHCSCTALQLAMVKFASCTTTTGVSWKLLAMACAMLAVAAVVMAADPDPLQDYCVADLSPNAPRINGFACKPRSNVSISDFVFTGFRTVAGDVTQNPTGAIAVLATPVEYPGLNTQGITHARLDFDLGGVVPLHTHPRAAETLFVIKGSVYTGFVSDDNQLFAATLLPGDVIIYPRGLSHFQLNVANETSITFNTLTSQSPGFLVTVNQIFEPNITSAVIEKSFGVDAATVQKLKESYPRL